MKNLNETFEDKDFYEMQKFKDHLTWREFILKMFNYVKDNAILMEDKK